MNGYVHKSFKVFDKILKSSPNFCHTRRSHETSVREIYYHMDQYFGFFALLSLHKYKFYILKSNSHFEPAITAKIMKLLS